MLSPTSPQVPAPVSPDEVTQPATGVVMHPAYAEAVATFAYLWGWPMANQFNRRAVVGSVAEPGRLQGVVPAGPRGRIGMLTDYIEAGQTFVACPNQDVVYGYGFAYADEEPVVIQIPDFGDRYWIVAVWDARTDSVGRLGKQYGTQPGSYLVVGPNWNGEVPEGIAGVVRSRTELVTIIPRLFMDDTAEDRQAVQPLINQIVVYPLAEYDGNPKSFDYSQTPDLELPSDSRGEMKWVDPKRFFDQLGEILDKVPPLPGEEAMYAQFRHLLDAAAKDPAVKDAVVRAAVEAERNVIDPFLKWQHNGRPAGNGWNRSANNAAWGIDYFDRTGECRSNIYENTNHETQYMFTDVDGDGAALDGSHRYQVTFAAGNLPPVRAFWSMTLYNEGHLFHPNELNRFSLGTKNQTLRYGDDGSLTLYAGSQSPGPEKERNWLPAPNGPFSLYLRAYWPEEAVLDGTWQPPAIERVH